MAPLISFPVPCRPPVVPWANAAGIKNAVGQSNARNQPLETPSSSTGQPTGDVGDYGRRKQSDAGQAHRSEHGFSVLLEFHKQFQLPTVRSSDQLGQCIPGAIARG
jgi:hypothetical protein